MSRDYLVHTLCRQILGMENPDGSRPAHSPGIQDAASATLRVDIQGMVHNISRQIWLDYGVLADKVTAEIQRQAEGLDLDALVEEKVREAFALEDHRLDAKIADHVRHRIERAIDESVGNFPAHVAKKIAAKLYQVMEDS